MVKVKYLLVLSILLLGCSREDDLTSMNCVGECITLTGMLITGDNDDPIPNTVIEVYWDDYEFLGGTYRKKAVFSTNENGYFQVNFSSQPEELKSGFYEAKILASDQFLNCSKNGPSFSFSTEKADTAININYYLPRKANLRFIPVGFEDIPGGDRISLNTYYFTGVDRELRCGNHVTYQAGGEISTKVLETAADQPVVLEVTHYINNEYFYSTDTVELFADQILDYEVVYN
jgi:hypothetical protein